jgi:hypothetical protein
MIEWGTHPSVEVVGIGKRLHGHYLYVFPKELELLDALLTEVETLEVGPHSESKNPYF